VTGVTAAVEVRGATKLPDEGTLRLFGRTRSEAGPAWLDGVGGFAETPRFYPLPERPPEPHGPRRDHCPFIFGRIAGIRFVVLSAHRGTRGGRDARVSFVWKGRF
jgi:hypothetical protein